MIATILIAAVIVLYAGKVVYNLITKPKKTCGNCSGCPYSGTCH